MNGLIVFVLGWLMIAAIMFLTWRKSEQIKKAAMEDVVWTFSIGFLALFDALSLEAAKPRRSSPGFHANLTPLISQK